MLIARACPQISPVTEFTWFGLAETQLRLYGFFAMTMFGAIYYLLPRVVGFEWPFPKLARVHFWISMLGVLLLVVPLAIGGVVQGLKWANPGVAPVDVARATLPFLRVSTTGLLFLLAGNLLFALNVFGLTLIWKLALLKKAMAIVKAPLNPSSVQIKSGLRRVENRRGEGMKNGALVFLAVFVALGLSWCGFVLAPTRQLGGAKQTTMLNSSDLYPVGRPGEANQGLQVYRANGCAACHTEQVRQTGVACNVIVTDVGKNRVAVQKAIPKANRVRPGTPTSVRIAVREFQWPRPRNG